MVYLDACVVIAAITDEPRSGSVLAWLDGQAAGTLFYSAWVDVEVFSALSIKIRTGALALEDRAVVAAAWMRDLRADMMICPIAPEHFEAAARYCEQHDLGLRAGDALHLAIARGYGLQLATLDMVLAEAAARLGIEVTGV